jgi:HTH-type transcriptional repressor of NAD biosynthesis genes
MHGLVLGKFMPPHRGHLYLVDFARHFTPDLTVVVGSIENEPIPGELRWQWMRELFPQLRVVHLTDENPQLPHEHPDFWQIWKRSLERVAERPVDLLFASEDYGMRLASELGARFVPTSGGRDVFKVSGTEVRARPGDCWDALPACVRSYYVGRISIFGPESTGKTTLARQLAERFQSVVVPEFARTWLELKSGKVEPSDMPIIARGQTASEEALARQANRILICDTDPLATVVWSRELFHLCSDEVEALARDRRYDLTLLLDVDVPWVPDPVRYRPEQRGAFLEACREELQSQGRRVVEIRGDAAERLRLASQAVEQLLETGGKL